jgi:hypothetical protein
MDIESELTSLNKILNSNLIKGVYTELDRIDVSLTVGDNPFLIYKIYLNDDVTKKDLYKHVDPFWLIDYHVQDYITKLIPFKHLPINSSDYQVEIYNKNGGKIFDWLHDLMMMNPGSTGRTQWERMSKSLNQTQ